MAIIPETQYVGKITPSTPAYPFGQARNITTPGDGTGTPWDSALLNDVFGFQQKLLDSGGVVPSGSPDSVTVSQYYESMINIVGRSFAAVSLMKASLDLAEDQTIKTVAFYDGWAATVRGPVGGAIYSIVTKATHDIVRDTSTVDEFGDHTLDNGLVALIINPEFAEQFGAKGNGIADDTLPIQAGIDSTSGEDELSAGGLGLRFGEGRFMTGNLSMRAHSKLIGAGMYSTELFLITGTNDNHISFVDDNCTFCIVRDLQMEGNKSNQTGTSSGLHFDRTVIAAGSTGGGQHRLVNVWVKNYLNSGAFCSGKMNGTTFERCLFNFNDEFGVANAAGDIVFSNCQAFFNKLTGFSEGGVGCQYSNCKTWLNGHAGGTLISSTGSDRQHGFWFRVDSRECVVTGCIAQENYGHGFYLDECDSVSISGCHSDQNGVESTTQGPVATNRIFDNFHFKGAINVQAKGSTGAFIQNTNPGAFTARYGVYIDDVTDSCSIDINVNGQDAGQDWFYNPGGAKDNHVIISGKVLTTSLSVTTVTDISSSTEPAFGLTLLDSATVFTQVTMPVEIPVPPAGTFKMFRSINSVESINIIVESHVDGILTQTLNTTGDTLVLMSNGSKWETFSQSGTTGRIGATHGNTVDFTDETRPMNTSQKYIGKAAFNATTGTPLWATGPLPADTWVDATSTLIYTPS